MACSSSFRQSRVTNAQRSHLYSGGGESILIAERLQETNGKADLESFFVTTAVDTLQNHGWTLHNWRLAGMRFYQQTHAKDPFSRGAVTNQPQHAL
ncbi:hypothetical protein SLA2020_312310 [Shorea laevis]